MEFKCRWRLRRPAADSEIPLDLLLTEPERRQRWAGSGVCPECGRGQGCVMKFCVHRARSRACPEGFCPIDAVCLCVHLLRLHVHVH